LVEHWPEESGVTGSNPVLTTKSNIQQTLLGGKSGNCTKIIYCNLEKFSQLANLFGKTLTAWYQFVFFVKDMRV
jgi:hypothetical protein